MKQEEINAIRSKLQRAANDPAAVGLRAELIRVIPVMLNEIEQLQGTLVLIEHINQQSAPVKIASTISQALRSMRG